MNPSLHLRLAHRSLKTHWTTWQSLQCFLHPTFPLTSETLLPLAYVRHGSTLAKSEVATHPPEMGLSNMTNFEVADRLRALNERLDDQRIDQYQFEREQARLQSLDKVELPEAVTRLESKHGTRIFLVGTNHFNANSEEDVSKTIRAVEPDVVMVELDHSRAGRLQLDDEALLKSRKVSIVAMMRTLLHPDVLRANHYLLLSNYVTYMNKKLGTPGGGEFRRAYIETNELQDRKKTKIHLGDRSDLITIDRALVTLSLRQILQWWWTLMTERRSISQEKLETMKAMDAIKFTDKNMNLIKICGTKELPFLSPVLVGERDKYMATMLSISEKTAIRDAPHLTLDRKTHVVPSVIVGVVGIGHVSGIVEEWNKLEESQLTDEEKDAILKELKHVPPGGPSASTWSKRLFSLGFRVAQISLILWACLPLL